MKLIDILVQELPKSGGWPEGYDVISTNGYKNVWAYKTKGAISGRELHIRSETEGHVTREQYEAALAASKQDWDGVGMPPVGCECEFFNDDYDCRPSVPKNGATVKIVAHQKAPNGIDLAVFVWVGEMGCMHAEVCIERVFRPIRSEADRKRDESIHAMESELYPCTPALSNGICREIYDAIAAGKIPHIRID